jgi:3-oxoacyl-[acyl-carrier protein] reductase
MNKLALVFGGSRGIGAATVEALARDGYDVAQGYVSTRPNALPFDAVRIEAFQVDITNPEDVLRAFDEVEQKFGRNPDCVVVNAGINVPPGPIATFDPANFRKLVEVNIIGAFNALQVAAQRVADGGSIIAMTTSLVRNAVPGVGAYSASKAAVECLVRSMSKELAPRKVRVNAVAPGPVDTDLFRTGKDDAAIARSAGMSVFNRVGQPEEIADVIAFVASNKASWVTGQIIQPNGGMI